MNRIITQKGCSVHYYELHLEHPNSIRTDMSTITRLAVVLFNKILSTCCSKHIYNTQFQKYKKLQQDNLITRITKRDKCYIDH